MLSSQDICSAWSCTEPQLLARTTSEPEISQAAIQGCNNILLSGSCISALLGLYGMCRSELRETNVNASQCF